MKALLFTITLFTMAAEAQYQNQYLPNNYPWPSQPQQWPQQQMPQQRPPQQQQQQGARQLSPRVRQWEVPVDTERQNPDRVLARDQNGEFRARKVECQQTWYAIVYYEVHSGNNRGTTFYRVCHWDNVTSLSDCEGDRDSATPACYNSAIEYLKLTNRRPVPTNPDPRINGNPQQPGVPQQPNQGGAWR